MFRNFFYTILIFLLLTSTAFAKGEKLLLVGSGNPDPKDDLLIENLEKWGYVVEPEIHTAKHPVNLDGIDLVFISESTSSANILGAYKDSTVPVVNAESFTYDDMSFALNNTFNSDVGDKITIVNTDHPITAGFKGDITVSNPAAKLMTCSGLDGDVDILAVRADNDTLVAISVYEKGAKTLDGSTKAIHINIWPHSTAWAMVTDDGWELVHRSILYGLGQIATDVTPQEKLAVTWGQIKSSR